MWVLASSLQKRSNMKTRDRQSKHKNKSLKEKGKMEIIAMLTSKKVKEGESEVVGVSNTCRLINKVMNLWIDSKMVEDIINEKDEVMNWNLNWLVGERIVGFKKKE